MANPNVFAPGGGSGPTNGGSIFTPINVASSATGGTSQSPNASSLQDLPGNLWIRPDTSPATWGYAPNDQSQIYVGSNDPIVSPRNVHVLVAQIAASLHLKPQKGMSTEEQVIGALSKQYGLNTNYLQANNVSKGGKGKPVPKSVTDSQALGAVLAHVTGQTSTPGGGVKTQPKLGDQNAWAQIAQSLHIQTSDSSPNATPKTDSWQHVATGILGSLKSSTQISQLQAQLYAGGFYDETQMADPKKITEGNLDGATIKALGMALQATQAANAKGQNVNWTQYLSSVDQQAGSYQSGQQLGDYLNASGATPTSTATGAKTIPQATQTQLAPSMRQAFEADLGFAPSAQQLADFTAQYDTLQQAHAGDATPFSDQQGIPQIPGIAAPLAAAGQYAVNADTAAYLGHQMSNTMALIQNAMVSGGSGTSARPLGSDANITTAARQI
jgi:hypothetical protein